MCRKCGCPVVDMSSHRDNQWKLWSCLVPSPLGLHVCLQVVTLNQDESNNMSHLKVCNLQGSKFHKKFSVYICCIYIYICVHDWYLERICLMHSERTRMSYHSGKDHTHVRWLGERFSCFEASGGTRCPTVASWTCASRISEFSRVFIKTHDHRHVMSLRMTIARRFNPWFGPKEITVRNWKGLCIFFVSTCRYLKGCFPICYFYFALL